MNLENMKVNASNQTQKATYCMIPFAGKEINTFMWTEISGCLGLGEGGLGMTANGDENFGGDENVLESDSGGG